MLIVKRYDSFNQRRYGNPWIARVSPKTAKIDFSVKCGGYTGRYNAGESGDLYITDPQDGAVYAYGQKDYRGNNGGYQYIKVVDGKIVDIDKTELINALSN